MKEHAYFWSLGIRYFLSGDGGLCSDDRNVYVGDKSISEVSKLNVEEAIEFFSHIKLNSMKKKISEKN